MSDEEKGNSLIYIKDSLGLSKPGTALIEKISAGLGGTFAPSLAKQRAKARKIEVLSDIEISDIQKRAELRDSSQNIRTQENIESITKQAIKELPSDAKVENIQKMDEDWIADLFKHCDTVSDKEMQSLWARILAGEAAKPGNFSKRTLALVSTLDKKEATLFTAFSQFVWINLNKDNDLYPLIYNEIREIVKITDEIYTQHDIYPKTLELLDSIGLILYNRISERRIVFHTPNYISLCYYDIHVKIHPRRDHYNNEYHFPVGTVEFTSMGKELFPICGAKKNDEFLKYVINIWKKEGLNPVVSKQTQLPNTATE